MRVAEFKDMLPGIALQCIAYWKCFKLSIHMSSVVKIMIHFRCVRTVASAHSLQMRWTKQCVLKQTFCTYLRKIQEYKIFLLQLKSRSPLKIASLYDCLNIIWGVFSLTPIYKLRKQKHIGKHFTNFACAVLSINVLLDNRTIAYDSVGPALDESVLCKRDCNT